LKLSPRDCSLSAWASKHPREHIASGSKEPPQMKKKQKETIQKKQMSSMWMTSRAGTVHTRIQRLVGWSLKVKDANCLLSWSHESRNSREELRHGREPDTTAVKEHQPEGIKKAWPDMVKVTEGNSEIDGYGWTESN